MRIFFASLLILNLAACVRSDSQKTRIVELSAQRTITILATNDLHGSVEISQDKSGNEVGGLSNWSGYVAAIRKGIEKRLGNRGGVLLVDAGDQFQGTLISNYDEGQLVFRSFSQIGYDAVVPGNHDYDFGPVGWLVDKANKPEQRREALERLVEQASFPLLSGNTFLKSSILNREGRLLNPQSRGCTPQQNNAEVDWDVAKTPSFLQPYLIKNVAGVRVALIGIDLPKTAEATTKENVSDLCFGNELDHYLRLRKKIQDQADIFVLVMHQGDSNNDKAATHLVQKLTAKGNPLVDAVISGHTHFTYNEKINSVPLIQSGSGGISFGRIDLVWNAREKKLIRTATKNYAGLLIFKNQCDKAIDFCSLNSSGNIALEGEPVESDKTINTLIEEARKNIAPLASKHLGVSKHGLTRDRISENSLANWITDQFRSTVHADIALVNMGGLRSDIQPGSLNYEGFFKVLPFNNLGVVIGPLATKDLIGLLKKSIKTCGSFGSLMQSGLMVKFKRSCSQALSHGGVDPHAELASVHTEGNRALYREGRILPNTPNFFRVVTIDFLASGGDGFDVLAKIPLIRNVGIMREVISDSLSQNTSEIDASIDRRWENLTP